MSPGNDSTLCGRYPLLCADRHRSMWETCMCWGFECGDMDLPMPEMDAAIDEAEAEAGRTREECGAPGQIRSPWRGPLCDACMEASR